MPGDHRPEDAPFDGRWWLPEDSSIVVGGRLELHEDTWRIVLMGWLGPWDNVAGAGEFPSQLHGQVGTTAVSLLDLVPEHFESTFLSPPHRATLSARTVIFGSHLDQSTLFTHASVRLVSLNEWANRRPWSSENGVNEHGIWRHKGVYTPPENLDATVPGAKVTLGRSFGHTGGDFSEMRMWSEEHVDFALDTPLDLAAVEHDYVRPLRYLVELASGARSAVLELTVMPEGSGRLTPASEVLSAVEARAVATPKAFFRFLFNLGSVPFEEVVPAWWTLHSEIGPVSDLVASLWDGSRNISNRFLDGASAIEGYHRHRFPGPDRTFAQRVDAVAALGGQRFAAAVGDPVRWRNWVRDGRNSVAHRDPSMVDLEREWRTTIGVAASMQWLLILVLLADLSIPDAVVEEGLRQNRPLEQVEGYLRSVKPEWF